MRATEQFLTRRLLLTVGAGFAFALLLMVSVGILGLTELSAADARQRAIVRESSQKGQVANAMRDLLRARVISMLSIVVMNDPFEKDREMLHFYSLGESYQKSRTRLALLPATGEERAVLDRVDALTARNQPVMIETVNLGMEGYTFLAFDLLQQSGISLQRQLVVELDRLVSIQQQAIESASQQAEQAYAKTRVLMLILGAASALVASLVALFVLRRTRQISAASERERTRFQTLFETNTDGIVILDRTGFVQCNPATLRMFGIASEEDFLTLTPEQLAAGPIDDQDSPTLESHIDSAFAQGYATFEWRCRRADGSDFPANIDLHAMILDGRPHLQCIIRDVTAQKEAQQALKSAHTQALAAAEMKSQFVANVSHEIRTPMNGIMGMTRLLLGTELSARQREYAEAVDNSSLALMHIINDLLDFSKIEAGRLSLEEIDFDLPQTLQDIIAFYRPRTESKGLTFRLDMPKQLLKSVHGDSLRLRQILLNLLDNAIKFTEHGGIRLSVEGPRDADNLYHFRVSDTGIGISASAMPTIFSAFSQADGTISRQFGGTGLGLTICKQLSDLMGGQLTVTSVPGQGSVFELAVPLRPGQDTAQAQTRTPRETPHFRPKRVLVAEDNPINQKLVEFMLENLGLKVDIVGDGKQAYEHLIHSGDIDLVLMDCQMPVWDGLAAARAIREYEVQAHRRRVPIVALTANAMQGFDHVCEEAGMDGYLTKPLEEAQLADCLLKWLPEQSVAAAPPVHEPANALLDIEKIRRLCRNRPDQVKEMLELFVTSTEKLLADLNTALADNRVDLIARLAHQIKGAAAYLGASATTELAARLEQAGKNGDRAMAEEIVEDLEADFIRLRSHIESITP